MSHLARARTVFDIELAALKAVRARLDQNFDHAVELIVEALKQRGKIVIVGIGKSGNIGQKIAATLNVDPLSTKPVGMSIDPQQGTIRWTPSIDQIGTNKVVLRAIDANGGFSTQTYDIVVRALNIPPQIVSAPPTIAQTNTLYQYQVRVFDAENDPLAFTLTSGPTNMGFVFQNADNSLGTNRVFSTDGGIALIWWTPTPNHKCTGRRFISFECGNYRKSIF